MGEAIEPVDFQSDERQGGQSAHQGWAGEGRTDPSRSGQADDGLDRRFRWALVLYCFLGVLVWFTMGTGKVLVEGKPVELRLVPLIVIGGLALRTVVAHRAEKIRQGR